jgi:putative addiction module component (TIGR02574 family)
MYKTNEIMDEIDSLPIDIKTQILERILHSINPTQEKIDRLWAKEAEKRVKEIESGKVDTIPGDKVFEEIRKRLDK